MGYVYYLCILYYILKYFVGDYFVFCLDVVVCLYNVFKIYWILCNIFLVKIVKDYMYLYK